MKPTRTNALNNAPSMPGYAIPSEAGIQNQLLIPVLPISLHDPVAVLPANTEQSGPSFSVCGRRLTRLPPCIETRCVAGNPTYTGTVFPEVA